MGDLESLRGVLSISSLRSATQMGLCWGHVIKLNILLSHLTQGETVWVRQPLSARALQAVVSSFVTS